MPSVAVIQHRPKQLARKGFIWLIGYSPSLKEAKTRKLEAGVEGQTMEEWSLLVCFQAPVQVSLLHKHKARFGASPTSNGPGPFLSINNQGNGPQANLTEMISQLQFCYSRGPELVPSRQKLVSTHCLLRFRGHSFGPQHLRQTAHSYLQLQLQGIQFLLLASTGTHTLIAYTNSHAHIHTQVE